MGTVLNCNGSVVPNIKALSAVVTKAMLALLQKGRKLSLDVNTMLHLFHTMIKLILLHSGEVCGYCNTKLIEHIKLGFLRMGCLFARPLRT